MMLNGMGGSALSPMRGPARLRALLGLAVVLGALLAALAWVSPAGAAQAPEWEMTSYSVPTNLPPETKGELVVNAVNVGGASTDGSTITLQDVLPAGLKATKISGYDTYAAGPIIYPFFINPSARLSCEPLPALVCTSESPVLPGDQLSLKVRVEAEAGAPASVVNQASVSGGGAPAPASTNDSIAVSSEPSGSGIVPSSVLAAFSSHQAGEHANVTTEFALKTHVKGETFFGSLSVESEGTPKDVSFTLPPGAVGNTVGIPRCPEALAYRLKCPTDTIVGLATTQFRLGEAVFGWVGPVYNIVPSPGEPAAFMFVVAISPVRLDTSVLSDGNYAVKVTAGDLGQIEPPVASSVTIWGVPADHQGPGSVGYIGFNQFQHIGGPSATAPRVPLLSNPTQCSRPLTAVAEADFWRKPGVFSSQEVSMGTLTGCLNTPFESSFTLLPDTLEAGAPAGFHFDLHVNNQDVPDSPATSDVKRVALTLPEGVVVNPAAAWGLKACSAAAFYGPEHPSQKSASFAKCPREAQVGQVSVKSPALEEALEGQVYLAEPECHPCSPQDAESGKMVKLFVQMNSEGEGGIIVKLEGHGMIDQKTGQITTVFDENPQLPFDEFKLKLTGGPRSVLANPRKCGTVTAVGDLEPWSILQAPGELGIVSDSHPFYEFQISQNCFGAQFDPSLVAGSPNIQAGAYTPFTLSFGRSDNDEFLSGFSMTMPPGLLGNISSVALCKEPQASQGKCDDASLIGHTQVLTGPGADPFLVTGGKVFLTEGYKGAPYGLSIVVPAVAGPYTLSGTTGEGTVVVRAKVEVDPLDAHLHVTADPLPTILDGIPLQLKVVNVTIDRSGGFTFNPTSCEKMAIDATMSSSGGMTASKSSSFQVTNCARLTFKPLFKAFTSGKTSRRSGASLTVNLSYPKAAWGSQANIRYVKVDLPKQLPSYLETLQKACPVQTFQANPAACPSGSIVGRAEATTPVIPVPLTGPAYFVSHGGAKWPELVIVLSGYGVTVQLHGETFISKGVTSSTFKYVPDVPIGSFQLTLPQGENHALSANGNLCAADLRMPTTFTAQNGMTIQQSTHIVATGCAKHKIEHHHKKKHKRKHKNKK